MDATFFSPRENLYSLQQMALRLLDASPLSERLKNSYRAIVWFLPKQRVMSMIEKLNAEKMLREEILRRTATPK